MKPYRLAEYLSTTYVVLGRPLNLLGFLSSQF